MLLSSQGVYEDRVNTAIDLESWGILSDIYIYLKSATKLSTKAVKYKKISTNVSPFSGISFVNVAFDKIGMSQLVDNELGARVKTVGFSYSDIIKNLCNVFIVVAIVPKISKLI